MQQLNQLRPLVWPATPTATNDPGELKVTIRKFYRISGASTQFKGVTSDIILPDPLDFQKDIQSETTLDNPLPWDTIAGTPYNKFNLVRPYLAELGKKSAARTATNPDFIYLREEIEQTKKHNADRTLTLNEREAIQERQTNHAKQKAREAEITARRPANMKVYEITLADAAKPGLPAPSYYPGILETNETTTVTSNHLAVVRQEFIWDDNLSSFFADTNSAVADTASAVRQMFIRDGSTTSAVHQKFIREGGTNLVFTTNAIPRDSTTNGLFTIKTIKVKKQPDLDPLLQETDHIMQDYISLLSQKGGLTTKQ